MFGAGDKRQLLDQRHHAVAGGGKTGCNPIGGDTRLGGFDLEVPTHALGRGEEAAHRGGPSPGAIGQPVATVGRLAR